MHESKQITLGVTVGITVAVAVFLPAIYLERAAFSATRTLLKSFKSYEEILFENLDVDGDGLINTVEFAVVAPKITPQQRQRLDIEDKNITLKTFFQPLVLSSLRSFPEEYSPVKLKESGWDGLVQWRTAEKPEVVTTTRKLSYFLPPMQSIQVGNPWALFLSSGIDDAVHLCHDPPAVTGIQAVLTEVLKAFHPRPFIQPRFGPQGGHAVLRARSDQYYDIVFRFHAEFQLNVQPIPPFWFTPGQFTGNIVISENGSEVRNLRIFVPTKHELNVDMELVSDADFPENLVAEIGYLPQMEARSGHQGEDIEWTESIGMDRAVNLLEKTFYPFKQVDYLPLDEAFHQAKLEGKLVHSIVLWGSGRTLREGTLSSSPIISLLRKHFVSTWSLLAEIKSMATFPQGDVAQNAKITLDAYTFPVQISLHKADGTILYTENLNDLFDRHESITVQGLIDHGFTDGTTYNYYQMLLEALEMAEVEL